MKVRKTFNTYCYLQFNFTREAVEGLHNFREVLLDNKLLLTHYE